MSLMTHAVTACLQTVRQSPINTSPCQMTSHKWKFCAYGQVQLDSRGRKRPAGSDVPLDWKRYQKYDIFSDLLGAGAAAASPAAQVTFQKPLVIA